MTSSSCSLSTTSSDLPETESLDFLKSACATSSAGKLVLRKGDSIAGCETFECSLERVLGAETALDAYCSEARYPICSSGYADKPEAPRLISNEYLSKDSSTVYRVRHLC